MAEVRIEWNDGTLALAVSGRNPNVKAVIDQLAAKLVQRMKFHAPVSPVFPVYKRPAPVRGGRRYAGDFPLRPSGYLRSSIHAFRMADGSVIVGPTADYAEYVEFPTRPHIIRSTGPWPLRNRATGQVFGRVVHHPGTKAQEFMLIAAKEISGATYHA